MHIFVRMTTIFFELIVVMHISVRMTTFSFWIDFRHAHFCMNDYHFFLKGFSSFTFLYEWPPFLFEWIVVIYISVQMATISFWMDCRHLNFCTNDYHFFLNRLSSFTFLYGWLPCHFEWIFVIYISVRTTTIPLYMDFCHAHSVQMTFHILCTWIFVMHISMRMTFHNLLVFPFVQCSLTLE